MSFLKVYKDQIGQNKLRRYQIQDKARFRHIQMCKRYFEKEKTWINLTSTDQPRYRDECTPDPVRFIFGEYSVLS